MCDKRCVTVFLSRENIIIVSSWGFWVITPWHEILHGVVIPLRQPTVWYDSLSDDEILALVLFDREASTVKCKWEDGEKQTNRNLLPACYFTTVTVRMIPVKQECHRAASESNKDPDKKQTARVRTNTTWSTRLEEQRGVKEQTSLCSVVEIRELWPADWKILTSVSQPRQSRLLRHRSAAAQHRLRMQRAHYSHASGRCL